MGILVGAAGFSGIFNFGSAGLGIWMAIAPLPSLETPNVSKLVVVGGWGIFKVY